MLVVGGGRIALRKVQVLLDAGARVTVVSPELTKELKEGLRRERISYNARKFHATDLDDVALVISATNDQKANREVFELARLRNIFCNVVDRSDLCTFISPAIVSRGPIQIAISTSATDPRLASRIKEELNAQIDQILQRSRAQSR